MILVTVGTQIPFDRLIKSVDDWVGDSNSPQKIMAQVGQSDYCSENMTVFKSVEPEKFEQYILGCDFLVSHAGMGSILTALRVKKPIIIVPRKAALGEHRNDHQLATARSFSSVGGVYVANTEEELFSLLNSSDQLLSGILDDSDEYKKLLANLSKLLGE
jgi:UDP-N-acetylglucosamine transferase subunit ALG13